MSGFTTLCKTCNETVSFRTHPVPGFQHILFAMHDECGSIWYIAQNQENGKGEDLIPQYIEAIAKHYGIEPIIVD